MLTMSSYLNTKREAMAEESTIEGQPALQWQFAAWVCCYLILDKRRRAMPSATKVALITGANKGIGFEIARQLGAQGMIVLVGARDRARGEEAVERLQSEGVEASAIHLDVTDQVTIDAAASYIDKTYGKLDVLVNNAGVSLRDGRVPPSELAVEVFRATYETNVFGVFAVTKARLPLLRGSVAGPVVNISSPSAPLCSIRQPHFFSLSGGCRAYTHTVLLFKCDEPL